MNTLSLRRDATILLAPVCSRPETLQIRVGEYDRTYAIVVNPGPEDIARFIGSGGANFMAMRTILQFVSEHNARGIRYMVNDSGSARTSQPRHAEPSEDWDAKDAVQAATTAMRMAGHETIPKVWRRPNGRQVLTPTTANGQTAPLPLGFGTALARWVHVIARSHGGSIDFEFDPA